MNRTFILIMQLACGLSLSGHSQVYDSLPPQVAGWDTLLTQIDPGCVRKFIFEGSTRSLAHLTAGALTLRTGKDCHPASGHPGEEELIIVKEGKLGIQTEQGNQQLGPGSVAYFLPGEKHRISNRVIAPATCYIFRYRARNPLPNPPADVQSRLINWDTIRVQPTEKGQRRELLNGPTTLLAKFEMHTTALRPGLVSHAPHTHREEEIILILRGEVTLNINGERIAARAGDVAFLPSGVSHALENTGSETCEYFAFQWRD